MEESTSCRVCSFKELHEVTKCVNNLRLDKDRLKLSGLKKHEIVNQISGVLGDSSTIAEKRSQTRRNPLSLKSLTQRTIMKKSYPKKVLTIAYSNFIWPRKKRQWNIDARVADSLRIYGIEQSFEPYYVPDENAQGDFEVFVYDKTHLGSNLRKCICLDKVLGVSKQAWVKVSEQNPEILNLTLLEVTKEGKIIDQMKERLARTMVTEAVEIQMQNNGNTEEAYFCKIIREGLYEADDVPGIPAIERCRQRLGLIQWLSDGIDFGDFPPYGSKIKGLSTTLYEGLRTSNEAKLYLYCLVKKGAYCVRSPNTLCSESFFSSMQEMDPWDQGVLTSDGIEKHISGFTTITALKMKDERPFYMRTKRDTVYPTHTLSKLTNDNDVQTEEDIIPTCRCRADRFIKCIVPKDHFFDTKSRARRSAAFKPYKFSGVNKPGRGDLPVRSQYGYKINETKVLPSKRIGIKFSN